MTSETVCSDICIVSSGYLYCRVRAHLGGMEPQHGGGPTDHDLLGA